MSKPLAKKRVSFQLEQSLANLLSNRASQAGVSKSRLVREWLAQQRSTLQVNSRTKLVSYNLQLEQAEWDLLESLSQQLNLSHSELLRRVIKNSNSPKHISKHDAFYLEDVNAKLRDLWLQGKAFELIEILSDKPEQMTTGELVLLADCYLNTAQVAKSRPITTLLKSRTQSGNDPLNCVVNYLSAWANQWEKNFNSSPYFFGQAQQISESQAENSLLGRAVYGLAEVAAVNDDFPQAIKLANQALQLLDPERDTLGIIEALLRLSKAYSYLEDWEQAAIYRQRVADLLYKRVHLRHLGWYFNTLGIEEYMQGRFQNALRNIHSSIRYYDQCGATHFHNNEKLGRIYIAMGDYDKAHKYLEDSLSAERVFTPSGNLLRAGYLKLFIESKHKYSESIQQMQQTVDFTFTNQKQGFMRYLLHTAQYVHGPTAAERANGESGLKQLVSKGNYPFLRRTAQNTLITKRPQPIA